MIVRPESGGLLLLTQESHAHLSGDLAERLREVPGERGPFVRATREHDNGWREYDAEAHLDAQRDLPVPYTQMPHEEYRAIWRRGIDRAAEMDPYVGLLVSLHGMRHFAKREGEENRAFYEAERRRQDALLGSLALGGKWDALPEPLRRHHAWLGFLDGLSLFALDLWRSPWVNDLDGLGEMEVRRELGEIVVDPWPFDTQTLRYEVTGRYMPSAHYFEERALATEFRLARERTIVVELRKG